MQLSTADLRHYLQDTPLVDWIHLHAKRWLSTQPTVFRAIYGDGEEADYFHKQMELQSLHSKYAKTKEAQLTTATTTSSTATTFYEHVLDHCIRHKIPSPPRINHSIFASSSSVIDQEHNTYVIVEGATFNARFTVDDEEVTLMVQPDALLSQPLATSLFRDKLPKKCTQTVFSRWVPVFFASGGKASVLKHTARSSRYEAMQLQLCQHALSQWTTEAHRASAVSCVGGVVVNVRSIANSRFYVHIPQPLVLNSKGQLKSKPYDWMPALRWAVRVRKEGGGWNPVTDTEHIELCTPIGTTGFGNEWIPLVRWLAKERGDMCQVYKVGANIREKAWQKGARTYHDLWDMQVELKSLKLHPLSLRVIWANHRSNPEKQMVVPRKISKPDHRHIVQHSKQRPYFIVDFETIRSEWIFMVATVYVNPLTNKKHVFTERMQRLTDSEQVSMLHRWVTKMNSLIPANHQPYLFHWSPAEPQFIKTLFNKNSNLLQQLQEKHPGTASTLATPKALHWIDLCNIFLNEPITVPTCFDFQLKHIIKALVHTKLLPANNVWEEGGVQDGRSAMLMAERAYKESTPSVFDDIKKYNEADVLVLNDLLVGVLWGMV